ncbi:cytochrome P450 2F1-like isoform X3 [Alligator sinensis]|uniref:Cytochrome P450 2F1-like isoform X3 n=1 Tax=Alligator sinensis TaxID=38654 RepID=A0A3Q0FND7_ALLSI|nr:cytochrome P450 2F1-like isoform X3 [Alligator sinensis]
MPPDTHTHTHTEASPQITTKGPGPCGKLIRGQRCRGGWGHADMGRCPPRSAGRRTRSSGTRTWWLWSSPCSRRAPRQPSTPFSSASSCSANTLTCKGTTVIPLLTSAHFEEGVWETPEDFNPGHFLDEKGAFRKREEAMPFSIGKRACPGEDLARLELLLFTTTLLQSLELELAGPPDAIDLRALRRAFRGSSLAFQLRARPRPRPL